MVINLDKGHKGTDQASTPQPETYKPLQPDQLCIPNNSDAVYMCPVCSGLDFLCISKGDSQTTMKCQSCQRVIRFDICVLGPKEKPLSKIEDDTLQEDRICAECKYSNRRKERRKIILVSFCLFSPLLLTTLLVFFGAISEAMNGIICTVITFFGTKFYYRYILVGFDEECTNPKVISIYGSTSRHYTRNYNKNFRCKFWEKLLRTGETKGV
ncbi:MAG: hypothetical protein HQM12_19550 [SAR324 cluster bacterium]|nr:hypothetical protein [SAR324 cluster bacterium]